MAEPRQMLPTLRFGIFEIDLRSGELRKAGIRVKLQEQPFKVLTALLERPGEVVSREELRQRIWPEATFGDGDHAVNVAVTKLRAALGDSAEVPHVIETLHRRGYRLIANVAHPGRDRFLPGSPRQIASDSEGNSSHVVLEPPQPEPSFYPAPSLRLVLWVTFTVALVAAVSTAVWLHNVHSPIPTRATVLIGPFENNTGEPVLDGTLQFALERELSNSQFVRVVSPERVQDILKLMRRPADARLDRALALDICRRTPDIRMLITGAVQKIGSHYLLTATILDPSTGSIIRSEESAALKQDEILAAVHTLSTNMRRDIGENIPVTPKRKEPLEEVTTPSLRALQLYSQANDVMIQREPFGEDIVELLRQALAEDPSFASAHVMLAQVLRNMGRLSEATPHLERALAQAHTASERERLFITGSYYGMKAVRPNDQAFTKAVTAYEELLRHHPDDLWALSNLRDLNNLGSGRDSAGRGEQSLQLLMRIDDLRPEMGLVPLYTSFASSDGPTLDRIAAGCDRESDLRSCQVAFIVRDARPIWQQLRRGYPEEALRNAQTLGRRYLRLYPKAAEVPSLILSDFYFDTGMLRVDAELAAETVPVSSYPDNWLLDSVLAAHYRGDMRAEGEALTPFLQPPHWDSEELISNIVESGRLQDARAVIAVREKRINHTAHWARGLVALAEGDIPRSIDHLRRVGGEDDYAFMDPLATALERAGRIDDALQVLRRCEVELAEGPDYVTVRWSNLDGRWHLARLYRQTGHIAEAGALEDSLRKQLKLADPDHIIARELKKLPHLEYALE